MTISDPATTAVTLAAGSIAVPALTIAGIPLGLRATLRLQGLGQLLERDLHPTRPRERRAPAAPRAQASGADLAQ